MALYGCHENYYLQLILVLAITKLLAHVKNLAIFSVDGYGCMVVMRINISNLS